MDATACAINEYQIVLVGGVNSAGKLTDLVEMYDVRENTWKLFEIGLSTPRRLMGMISSQKDRLIIIGGKEKDGSNSKVVEEIDFLKRNLVSLAHMQYARCTPNAFLVNDAIYVLGGSEQPVEADSGADEMWYGEKYTLSGNKWREIKPSSAQSKVELAGAFGSDSNKSNSVPLGGPAALLYE